jgi:hypothetical protein
MLLVAEVLMGAASRPLVVVLMLLEKELGAVMKARI